MSRPNLWTAEEVEMLRNNIIPPCRSERQARNKAGKLHIPFCPKGLPNSRALNLPYEKRKEIADYEARMHNKSHTALRFGVSRGYVWKVCNEFGVNLVKSPHERLGEHVEYEGHNYSWKKGSWICTAKKVRESGEYNLTKKLWKKYYGFYPDPEYDIRYKDGDKYNLKKSNLVLVTKSQAQKDRLKDPLYRSRQYAAGAMGLLMNTITEIIDPQKRVDRIRKAVETRRPKQAETIRKAVATRTKRAKERGYYFNEETRKRMSESRIKFAKEHPKK